MLNSCIIILAANISLSHRHQVPQCVGAVPLRQVHKGYHILWLIEVQLHNRKYNMSYLESEFTGIQLNDKVVQIMIAWVRKEESKENSRKRGAEGKRETGKQANRTEK
jgi:low temperature requirement protein LtrA